MSVGPFDDVAQIDRPGAKYGRFCAVRRGLRWHVVAFRPHVSEWRFMALPPFWRMVNACRVAQALHIERQHSYDEFRDVGSLLGARPQP